MVSDWEGIDRLSQPHGSDYRYCVLASVNAGIDMVVMKKLKSLSVTLIFFF